VALDEILEHLSGVYGRVAYTLGMVCVRVHDEGVNGAFGWRP